MAERMGYSPGELPVTESVSPRLLRLPLYYGIKEAQQAAVVNSIENFYESISSQDQSGVELLDRPAQESTAW